MTLGYSALASKRLMKQLSRNSQICNVNFLSVSMLVALIFYVSFLRNKEVTQTKTKNVWMSSGKCVTTVVI